MVYAQRWGYARLGYGRDIVYGGDGNDFIYGGNGNDVLYGERGDDYLNGYGRGNDIVYGGDGNDIIDDVQDNRSDTLIGGLGNDQIFSDGGQVNAGGGADYVYVNPQLTTNITLGTGRDLLAVYQNWYDYDATGPTIVSDFNKAEDSLRLTVSLSDYDYLEHGAVLDRLDQNNDGWLGIKDTAADTDPWDGYGVHVADNSLILEIDYIDLVFKGMTKASFLDLA